MAAPTTPAEALTQAFLQPASTTDKDRTVVERSLKDLQDAIDRQAGTTAGKKNHFGLRFTKLVPPGGG